MEGTFGSEIKPIYLSVISIHLTIYLSNHAYIYLVEKEWSKAVDGKYRWICTSDNGTWAVKNDYTVSIIKPKE